MLFDLPCLLLLSYYSLYAVIVEVTTEIDGKEREREGERKKEKGNTFSRDRATKE